VGFYSSFIATKISSLLMTHSIVCINCVYGGAVSPQLGMLLHQLPPAPALNACGIPGERQRATKQKQPLLSRKGLAS
jgi:hypothetical protein